MLFQREAQPLVRIKGGQTAQVFDGAGDDRRNPAFVARITAHRDSPYRMGNGHRARQIGRFGR